MKAILYTKEGKKKQEVVLNPEIFAARINERLLELIKNAYAANLRHGTHATKTRKEVSGGGKKPWKQKGTGRARHSSIRSPIWRHGGTTFGPHPRSYYVALPKSMRQAALVSALSLRGDEKSVMLLEDTKLESPKTKEWVEIFKKLPLDGKRALCVVKSMDETLSRASRNYLNVVEVETAENLNAFHILQRPKLVIAQDALDVIENRLSGAETKAVEVKAEKPAVAKKVAKTAKTKTVKKAKKS